MSACTTESGGFGEAPGSADALPAAPWLEEDAPGGDEIPPEADAALRDGGTRSALAPLPGEELLAQWMLAVAEQDERALAALYDATFSRVFGLVRRIVRDAALAEEVVEDAYFQVWRQAVRFDPARGKALTWLLAIARSRALDTLRREGRFRHEALDDDPAGDTVADTPPADELLDLARHQAQLQQALLQLGAQPRQLVSLAFFRGLSHEEIAQHTRLPLGTVKSQIRRALASLRQILGGNAAWTAAT